MKRFRIACVVSALAASLTLTMRRAIVQIGLLSAFASGLLITSPGLAIPATGSTAVMPTSTVGDPSGTRIVYTEVLTGNFSRARLVSSRPDGTDDVATVPATCAPLAACVDQIRNLTNNGAGLQQNFNPSWSPDGSRIAFAEYTPGSGNQFTLDIWTMLPDGQDRQQVTDSPPYSYRPDWGVAP